MILAALDKAGGVKYLTARAKDTPQAFLALLGKIIPQTVNANIRRSLSEYSDEELAGIAGGPDGEEGTGEAEEVARTLN